MLRKAVIIFFLLIPCIAFSQKTLDGGLFVGRSYYIGELNPITHVGNEVGSITYGGALRYNLNKRYSLKAALIYTNLSASDESVELEFSQFRDATFESNLLEFASSIEFNFVPFEQGSKKNFFTPYLFVGLSVYRYDPTTTVNGIQVSGSESSGGTKLAMPFGPGFKLSMGKKLGLSFEWGFRKTSNDEIDGLPNRLEETLEYGKNYDNDWYVVSGFMLTYRLTKINPCPYYGF